MAGLVIIVQARMESTRFQGKVLAPLLGQPLLLHVLDRVSHVPLPHTLVVATPATPENRVIQDLCLRHGYRCEAIEGDPADVLTRYARVAAVYSADVIVRITADCPLMSPEVIVNLVRHRAWAKADYGCLTPDWGDGFDCGVFTRDALNQANAAATRASDREHVEPWMGRESSGLRTVVLTCPFDLSWFRGSVDTPEDLSRVERLLLLSLDTGHGSQPDWRTLAALCAYAPSHREAMRRKALNPAYVAQVAAEEAVMTPEERAAYRKAFPQWHDAQGNYIPDSARKAVPR